MSPRAEATVGSRIRRFRNDVGKTLSQLALDSGVSKGYLSSLENEDGGAPAHRPSAQTLHAIAQALGVTMLDLLGQSVHTTTPTKIPRSLQAFAAANQLTDSDVQMLASIQFRGERPKSEERWGFLYNAIRSSEAIDNRAVRRPRKPNRTPDA